MVHIEVVDHRMCCYNNHSVNFSNNAFMLMVLVIVKDTFNSYTMGMSGLPDIYT